MTTTIRLIATEEAYASAQWLTAWSELVVPGLEAYEVSHTKRILDLPILQDALSNFELRQKEMDSSGVDVHVLSLTSPGVQVFAASTAVNLTIALNDELAELVRKNPTRYAGLAAIAPQDPAAAAAEAQRAIRALKLNGLIINSHTQDEYLDLPKYDPILTAAAQLGAPIYLHPRMPPPSMLNPFTAHGLVGALWGFAADAGLHAMRLIMSGVFDRHPGLIVVLGHMGEGIPYFLWRIDNIYKKYIDAGIGTASGFTHLERKPSEYFSSNIYITTSGMCSHSVLRYAIDTIGSDRIMFAVDYPYESSRQAVEFILSAPISGDDRAKIAHRNAERVFKIGPRD